MRFDWKSDPQAAESLTEFDCPECEANNPCDDGIEPGDEVRCCYCGLHFRVERREGKRWRFREL